MTTQQLLHDLDRRRSRIEQALADLKTDLQELHTRLDAPEEIIPAVDVTPPAYFPSPIRLPEIPPRPEATAPEPVPPVEEVPALPAATFNAPEPAVLAERPSFELRFGKWLASIGVVFALLTLVYFSILVHNTLYQYLGPWSKLTVLTLVSGALIATGLRLESRDKKLLIYGRTLAGGGLACLYYTLYGATYVPQLHVIPSPLFGGMLLLGWSAGVLFIAERRKSELLSVFALSLAYFSSAITPGNGFTMAADLILAMTAVIFLVRNAWSGLSYLCLLGTYAGFLRQAVVYNGPLDFQWIGTLPFWPSAVYLTGAWLIFTAGILLSRTPDFVNEKRMAFLCLNNGAWVGLLVLASHLGSFGHWGGILGAVGAAFLTAYVIAKITRAESRDIASAYLAQGLLFATGGLVVAYSGVTRGLLITIESVFLVASGAFSRKMILRMGGGVTAVLGAWYLANEIFPHGETWTIALIGTGSMLANAWLARRELWGQPREIANARWVPETVVHILLALGLLGIGVGCNSDLNWIFPGLAIAGLALALSVYALPLYELAPLSQGLLVAAQVLSFGMFGAPASPSNEAWFIQPQWSHDLVALVTMIAATWWSRQKLVRTRVWLQPLMLLYALSMVAFCYESLHDQVSVQTWMMSAALLSLVFLAYGAWSRLWAFMGAGQILLALSVFTFLNTVDISIFPWAWWAAAVPIGVVFATGWFVREILPRHIKGSEKEGPVLPIVARIYQSIAIGLLIRWVFGAAPSPEITLALAALGTAFILGGLYGRSSYGIRAGFVLNAAAICHYLAISANTGSNPFTWMDAGAFLLLLAQPALLRRGARELITNEESWTVIIISSAMGWLFVSNAILAAGSGNLTLGWALFAVALTVLGFVVHERRQRWCGLVVLAAAFVRVAVHDFWAFSDLYKVLTFLVLTVICLGMSFLYYKFADRLKDWL